MTGNAFTAFMDAPTLTLKTSMLMRLVMMEVVKLTFWDALIKAPKTITQKLQKMTGNAFTAFMDAQIPGLRIIAPRQLVATIVACIVAVGVVEEVEGIETQIRLR